MNKLLAIVLVIFSFIFYGKVFAQDTLPPGPVYIVQSGDNLTSIASQFGVTPEELISANGILDPNQLAIGDELLIPGLEGISGYLITRTVPFGSSLDSLAIENEVDRSLLTKLNHITSPTEIFTGTSLIIPEEKKNSEQINKILLSKGQSLLEVSIITKQNPWSVVSRNQLISSMTVPEGKVIYLTNEIKIPDSGLMEVPLGTIDISPLPMVQGNTIVFKVPALEGIQLSGSLTDHTLHFFYDGNGTYFALQGIHAMQEPGIYPLQLSMTMQNGSTFSHEQMVIINDGYYGKDPVLQVKDEFIDPTTTQPELDWLYSATEPATSEKYWEGTFLSPSPYSYLDCLNSRYGNRRSYNGGPFEFFHTGVDFCGGDGVKIFAPATGKIVFSGPLTVRGNATLIDHGWGVYSGYWHQTISYVTTGDMVEPGQVIGLVGATGRVTGAHLHWEVWAGGVQVSPLEWLQRTYP